MECASVSDDTANGYKASTGNQELFDVVSPTGAPLGTATRDRVHAEGLWHQVFHCLLVRSDQPERVVLQRRRADARGFPSKVDLSATGHLASGESPSEGVRELNEELGVSVSGDALVPAGVRLLADDEGEGMNRERVHLFFLTDDRPLSAFALSSAEVSGILEATIEDLLSLVAAHKGGDVSFRIPTMERTVDGKPEAGSISSTDLVPPNSGYWTVALLAAQRFARNEPHIAI